MFLLVANQSPAIAESTKDIRIDDGESALDYHHSAAVPDSDLHARGGQCRAHAGESTKDHGDELTVRKPKDHDELLTFSRINSTCISPDGTRFKIPSLQSGSTSNSKTGPIVSRFSQQQIHHPAPAHMRPRSLAELAITLRSE